MSGPLATWVGEHSKASWRGRAVLSQYALAANPDGTPAAGVTREDLERRTGMSRATIGRGRQEVEQLGELQRLDAGGGRGRLSRWRVVVTPCDPEAGCWSCDLLALQLQKVRPGPVPTDKRAPTEQVSNPKGAPAEHISTRKGRQQSRNVLRQSQNVLRQSPTTETGTAPTGGAVPHPGSDDREPLRVAGGSAARSSHKLDDPAPATAVVRAELQALKAQWRREAFRKRHGVDPPPDYGLEPPAPTEASLRAGPQVACEAPAGQESAAASDVDRPPVIPVADPADVTYPNDDLGAVAGSCVICQQACTSLHRVSGQVRHATCRDPVAKPAA